MFFILTYNLSPSTLWRHSSPFFFHFLRRRISSPPMASNLWWPNTQTWETVRSHKSLLKWISRRYDPCISSWKFNVLLSYPFYVLSFSPSFLLFFSFSLTRTMVTGNWQGIWKMAAVKQLEMWVDDIKHDYSFDEIKMMVKRSNMFFGCVWNTLDSMV